MSDRLLFVGLILFSFGDWLLTGIRHNVTGDAAAAGGLTSPSATIIWALIYVAAFASVMVGRKKALELARASLPLVLILLLACLSTLWSDQPAITARRSIELLGTVALAVYFASRLGLKAFAEALALAITIAAAVSLILVTAFPDVGLEPDLAMAGYFGSKNFLGEGMVLGMATIACLFGSSHGLDRVRQVGAFALCLVLLVGSGNGSGAGIAIMLALIIPILLFSRSKQSRSFALLGVLFSAAAILIGLLSEDVLSVLGKDATLTGRTILWQVVVDAISQKPAFGYGYAAFWGSNAPAASLVYPYIGWLPGTAHNGFLEVALNCGIIGEILFLWLLALALWRASAMFWQGRDILSGWPLFLMLCVIFKNITETSLLAHGEADWIVFVAAFVFATDARAQAVSGSNKSYIWERSRRFEPCAGRPARNMERRSLTIKP